MISKNLNKRILTSVLLLFSIFLIFNFQSLLVYFLIISSVLSIIEFCGITNKIFKNKLLLCFYNIFFSLYIFLFCIFFFVTSNLFQLKYILISFLFGCIASDIGGYVVGKIFKGPKLTKISPNKTISGAIGSIIFTIVIVSIFIFILTNKISLSFTIVSIALSLGCQFGDLFFSYLKRKANLKDTGNLLPGHGGVLDRVDGILLGLPVGFTTLILIL